MMSSQRSFPRWSDGCQPGHSSKLGKKFTRRDWQNQTPFKIASQPHFSADFNRPATSMVGLFRSFSMSYRYRRLILASLARSTCVILRERRRWLMFCPTEETCCIHNCNDGEASMDCTKCSLLCKQFNSGVGVHLIQCDNFVI